MGAFMPKTLEQLQKELDREIAYTAKLNNKIETLKEQLKDSIRKSEHEKEIARLTRIYESKLSEINLQPQRIHNDRGAGRKRVASTEVIARVLELSGKGLSQSKIVTRLSEESDIKISRTTVGEIVRGRYIPPD
jgi:predicted RNase H-like nuclease (RuvC/YqgF family)